VQWLKMILLSGVLIGAHSSSSATLGSPSAKNKNAPTPSRARRATPAGGLAADQIHVCGDKFQATRNQNL